MYVERSIKDRFQKIASIYNIVAIVGPRQAGKTTFLKESAKGRDAPYLLFDDPDVRDLFNSDIKKFDTHYLEGHELAVLDEVQYGQDAGGKLKFLADTGRHIWITSSSQTILGTDVLSWLVGRVSIVGMYPFSLEEYLRAKNIKEAAKSTMQRLVWEHIAYGGYPKVALEGDPEMKKTILRDLYETMVLKDVSRTFSINDLRALESFTKYLSHSIGNTLVYGKIATEMGLSFPTVKKYLDAMEKSYLIYLTPPFFTNKRKEVTKQPKVYFIDTGLRNAIANDYPLTLENSGKLFENYVLSELMKAGYVVKHWQSKGGAEVDFIVEINGKPIPIEVKLKTPSVIERSFRTFIEAYKPVKAFVVSYEGEHSVSEIDGCKVSITDVPGLIKALGG
jgi:predicted AAA+ superfamily ATPase